METQTQLGYYGKIPCKGDFVSRQLPRLFIEPWDQWLQECLVTSRDQLNERWLDRYLVSPIWRFALSAGICNENAWIGILMPSVDQVGRYFPLTLAVPVLASELLFDISEKEEAWFVNLEHIAMGALEHNNEITEFDRKVDSLGAPANLAKHNNISLPGPTRYTHAFTDQLRITTEENVPLSLRLNILLQQLILDRFSRYSLWWTSGSERVQPSVFISPDLPPAHNYQTFLSDI